VRFITILLYCCCAAAEPLAPIYDPSPQYPFGRPNPDAPSELAEFHFMVGQNKCVEERRNSSNGDWISASRSWDAHYYLNGFAIMDSGHSGKSWNGNLRAYDVNNNEWHVTFFSMPVYSSGVWKGLKEGNKIVLKQPQKAPGSGVEGVSRLTFSNISDAGFEWIGEWVSSDGSVVYPFWKISCQKIQSS